MGIATVVAVIAAAVLTYIVVHSLSLPIGLGILVALGIGLPLGFLGGLVDGSR